MRAPKRFGAECQSKKDAGVSYDGKWNVARTGEACVSVNALDMIPYCRNSLEAGKFREGGLWCCVEASCARWEYCDLPVCDKYDRQGALPVTHASKVLNGAGSGMHSLVGTKAQIGVTPVNPHSRDVAEPTNGGNTGGFSRNDYSVFILHRPATHTNFYKTLWPAGYRTRRVGYNCLVLKSALRWANANPDSLDG